MADVADDDNLDLTAVGSAEAGEPDEAEETIVSFGDEDAAPASSEDDGTQLVRQLRQQTREQAKELARLRASSAPKPQAIDPGPKPKLADCEWDEEAYEAKLDAWKDAKAKAAEAETAGQRAQEAEAAAWQSDLSRYNERKAALKVPDYQDAEDSVTAALNPVQQAVIVKGADNPALVILALGKHPAKLAELAKIADPIKLAVAVSKLEGSLKVTTTRKAPAPETIVRGNAASAPKTDKHLERLEAEAEKTGDRSKVAAYRRTLRA